MPPPVVSLVVTDLDGTFWHHAHDVPPAAVDAARGLAELGVPLLVATGRRLASTREPLARVGLAPPAVVLNGALGVDLATGARFHSAAWPVPDALAAVEAFATVGLAPVVYVDHPDVDVVVDPEPSTHPQHRASLGDSVEVGDLHRLVGDHRVLGFSMIGVEHSAAVAARTALGALGEVHLDRSIDYPGTATLTVAPKGRSKWDGVRAFCDDRGLDPTAVVAVADGPNDLELLDAAALRLVPQVAHPAALERADHVIPAAAEGGWATVLDFVGQP